MTESSKQQDQDNNNNQNQYKLEAEYTSVPATEEKKLNPEARHKVEEEKKGAASSPPNMTHVKTAPKITSHTLIGGDKDANGKS